MTEVARSPLYEGNLKYSASASKIPDPPHLILQIFREKWIQFHCHFYTGAHRMKL